MTIVAIVDFGLCNLHSIARAVEECGGRPRVTDCEDEIAAAHRIIVPGVGALPDAMREIRGRGLDRILVEQVIERRTPCLGICLGMHILATFGEEEGGCAGLSLIPGEVRRLRPSDGERVPHVGWNEVHPLRDEPLFHGIASGTDFYFVHSFHFVCRDHGDALARTPYCGAFTSAISRANILGVQFHPEKSQKWGFAVLRNFIERY